MKSKNVADGESRPLSDFIEYATLSYITNEITVSDQEKEELLGDVYLIKDLLKGLKEITESRYRNWACCS
ncbi:MAG: CopG family transcriptional regulator [Spirochaetes bacterium]|nr:CopG family transcriptional regulator [Spirochaetota bacterium]